MSDSNDLSLVDQLLIKEQDEINTWSRLVAQIFFAWYTVFLTFSGAALTWALGQSSATTDGIHHSKMWYGMLLLFILSLMGIVVTIPILAHMLQAKRRIEEIHNSLLGRNHGKVKAPIPATTAVAAYSIAMGAMATLAWIWWHLIATTV